uniref:Uncharacterized protein n=1 Tax=Salvator merianae TaxID=96440 RepID=A0A8D0CA58_SALMN
YIGDNISVSLHFHFLKTLEHRTDVSVMRTPYGWKGKHFTVVLCKNGLLV